MALTLACAPPAGQHAGSDEQLYVANAHDATVSHVSPAVGAHLGAPAIPAAPAAPQAWQVAVGHGGKRLITIGGGSTHGGEVTLSGRDSARWWTRRVDLEQHAAATLLSGDGQGHALIAYGEGTLHTRAPASACALALVNLMDGAVVGRASACAAGETVSALQLWTSVATGTDTPVNTGAPAGGAPGGGSRLWATVGVWSHRTGGRVVTLDTVAGSTLSTSPVPGVPTAILLGAGRVHVWVGQPPAEPWQGIADSDPTAAGSILTLGQPSLHAEGLVRLAEPVRAPSLGHGGDQSRPAVAYGLADAYRSLVAVDVETGTVRRLAQLPAIGSSVAVAGGKVFVAIRERDSLAVYDLTRLVSLPPVLAGRGPLALAVA